MIFNINKELVFENNIYTLLSAKNELAIVEKNSTGREYCVDVKTGEFVKEGISTCCLTNPPEEKTTYVLNFGTGGTRFNSNHIKDINVLKDSYSAQVRLPNSYILKHVQIGDNLPTITVIKP